MKHFFLVLLSIFTIIGTAASQTQPQSITIRGQVISSDDKQPLAGANVILNVSDSTLSKVQGYRVRTNSQGMFYIVSKEPKNDITISFLGYKNFSKEVPSGKSVADLGTITLETASIGLQGVVIIAHKAMAQVKGDTTEYNAGNFKTNPDATAEDLVKKIPGASEDGTSVGGQKIGKILINGKERFEGDPSLALKSLPSDAVESIKIFEDQTEDSKFSGFDSGDRVTTLNIITKPGVSKSSMGRIFGGYGTDQRNIIGANVNIFNEDHTWVITGQTHNIGGNAWGIASSGGRGGFRGMSSGGGINSGSFRTSAFSQVNRMSFFAMNYTGIMSEKFKMEGSYRFGNMDGKSENENTSDNLTSPRYTESSNAAKSVDNSHNLSLRMEWTPTPKNRILIRQSASYGVNSGYSLSDSRTTAGQLGSIISEVNTYKNTKYDSFDGSMSVWWQRAFSKPGRTMSLGGDISGNKGIGDNDQLSIYNKLDKFDQLKLDTIDRIGALTGSGYNMSGSFTLNERLSDYSKLSGNYAVSYNRSFTDQDGWNWDKFTSEYTIIDDATTNYMMRNYMSQVVGLGYNYSKDKKITFNASADYLFVNQYNYQDRPDMGTIENDYFFKAFKPRMSLRLTPKQGHNLNFRVAMNSGFPSVYQMQDVLDQTNPMNVSKGNPELKQSNSSSFNIGYNRASVRNFNFNINISGSQTDNFTASHRQFLTETTIINGVEIAKGAQYTTYVNLDGQLNASLNTGFGIGIEPLKGNFGLNGWYSLGRSPSILDNVKYVSTTNGFGGSARYTSNISEKIDFSVNYNIGFSLRDVKGQRFDRVYDHNVGGSFNVYLTDRLFVNGNVRWNNQFGSDASYTRHYATINSAIGYKVFKLKQGEIKFQAFDMLNQTQVFTTSMSDTFINTNYNAMILRKFYLVSLTYKFDTRKSKSVTPTTQENPEGMQIERRPGEGGGRPGGGYGGGQGGGRMMNVQ